MFIQNFYTLTTVFMDSKYSFRPNLLDIEKKILILPIPWHLFGPRQLYTKNQQKWLKMAKNGLFGPFDSQSYKNFFAEAY